MGYKTTREVQLDKKTYASGKPIRFTDDQDDARQALLDCGAIAESGASEASDEKPLAKMTKPELVAAAAKAGVAVAKKDDGTEIPIADATNAQIQLAINSKLAAG